MAKRPTSGGKLKAGSIRNLATDNGQQDAIDRDTMTSTQEEPIQSKAPKNKSGRPKKFKEGSQKKVVLLPDALNRLVVNDADKNAAGNVSATLLKIVAEYYGYDLKKLK